MQRYLNSQFYSMTCSYFIDPILCLVNGEKYNLLSVQGANASQLEIGGAIGYSAYGKSLRDYKDIIYIGNQPTDMNKSHTNSIKSLIFGSLLSNDTFKEAVDAADIK